MATETLSTRVLRRPSTTPKGLDRALGHPLAFAMTIAILIAVFGWTFFANPGRPAAADDPAYYFWRTEALLANEPQVLLDVDGPFDMYSGGYRVATPVLAGLMRTIGGVAALTPTVLLGVGLRVLIPVLLAGFAYRWRRDPLLWHAVAFLSASLLPTPPFAGYLDNVLTLLFLTASLYLIEPARGSWPARVAFGLLLLASGFTHPTTLAIFILTLGLIEFIRFVFGGLRWRELRTRAGPVVGTGIVAAVGVYATWKVGVWGESASLGEAALPPPAGADFFATRLGDWLAALGLPFNLPLFVIGVVALVRVWWRDRGQGLPLIAIAWLAPLVGLLGVFAGLTYPYYRFFNTTTAWLLVVGIGAYLVLHFAMDPRRRGSVVFGAVAVAILAIVVVGNFKGGLAQTHWNDVSDAWVKPDQKRDLEALRPYLEAADRPVVFVVDAEIEEPVRIYGFAKLAGNVTRYAVPGSLQDETAFFLGSVEDFRAGRATERDNYYTELSETSLQDGRAAAGNDPLVVVPAVFNETGSNVAFSDVDDDTWFVGESSVQGPDFVVAEMLEHEDPGALAWLYPLLLITILLLPGVPLLAAVLRDASFTDALGLILENEPEGVREAGIA